MSSKYKEIECWISNKYFLKLSKNEILTNKIFHHYPKGSIHKGISWGQSDKNNPKNR